MLISKIKHVFNKHLFYSCFKVVSKKGKYTAFNRSLGIAWVEVATSCLTFKKYIETFEKK